MKKNLAIAFLCILSVITFNSCNKGFPPPPQAKKYSSDVAVEWMKLQMRLTRSTPGFNSVVSCRSFAYAGLTLYESVVPGINNYQSIALQLGATQLNGLPDVRNDSYYWPASANAAMASITKSLFGNTSAANIQTIDSLESAFQIRSQSEASAKEIENSESFGKLVASKIFEWSKSDGGHEAYANVTSPGYIPPAGPGLWIPTPSAFSAPIHPGWGNNRSFVAGIANATQPAPPTPYSAEPGSAFYQMVNELYTISKSLSKEDSTIVKFWGDLATNYNVPAHAAGILTQLIEQKDLKLDEAVIAYAMHGIAMYDASISVIKTKYTYNLIRPVSYIRSVMGHPEWNTVIPTPPHPEYSAAHAVLSSASAAVLEEIFGKNFSFTDHTYDNLYGARSFNSFEDYAKEAGRSRLLGGIHYGPSIMVGLIQGRKVGERVKKLPFQRMIGGK